MVNCWTKYAPNMLALESAIQEMLCSGSPTSTVTLTGAARFSPRVTAGLERRRGSRAWFFVRHA
jgi:hypothetical protein